MPRVNPEILRWARETAGLSIEEAARKLGLKESRGIAAPARLAALEAGSVEPSRPMLVKMAKQYRRSLLVFYLGQPPRRGDRGRDFRTLTGPRDRGEDALLDVLIRNLRARQELVRALLEEEEEAAVVRLVGAGRMDSGVAPLLALIEQSLQISRDDLRAEPGPDAAFRLLRESAERAGVFVLLMGDLGNYHSAISLETFRGFAVADPVAPFIAINDRDSHAAWSFTLLHEMAHLCLGQTGVSALGGDADVERFCNLVSGEFLLPTAELQAIPRAHWQDGDTVAGLVSEYAASRNLSSTMVAARLRQIGAISQPTYDRVSSEYRQHWLDRQALRREAAADRDGGPGYYQLRSHRLGNALLDLVARTVRTQSLSASKAGFVLGVNIKQVQPLLDLRTFGGSGRAA